MGKKNLTLENLKYKPKTIIIKLFLMTKYMKIQMNSRESAMKKTIVK
jgi:hypothetical protein